MRLDKFLKVSRLVKRRTVANELCDSGGVLIDGKVAKASSKVEVNQTLTLLFGNRTVTVSVKEVPSKAVPAQLADTLYSVVETKKSY